jgi:LPXTG-site transpeptidase (sortase) family protein
MKSRITGVPLKSRGWDLTWLGNDVGWLEGTAAPTWNGNTVFTAHAYTSDGLEGPFARLKELIYGDTIVVHSDGYAYTYLVRSKGLISAGNTSLLTMHEEYDWITLITCQTYDEKSQSYLYRTVVRAILMDVEVE